MITEKSYLEAKKLIADYESEQLKSLKEQLIFIKKHLKWCKDNNKPQEHLDVHIKIIDEIKEEIKNIKQK